MIGVDGIPPRAGEGEINVLVEIPKGGHNKYELDERLGVVRLDRALYSAVYYPAEYGFVPATRGADGDRLDALVLIDRPTFPGCLVTARLVGALRIAASSGRVEHKLLAVPVRDPRFDEIRDVEDVAEHVLRELEHFFDVFRELEGSQVESRGWVGVEEADGVLERAIAAGRG